MATANLSVRGIEAIKPRKTPFRMYCSKTKGLNISVQPSGNKTWTVAFKFNGKRRYKKIGEWPLVGIATARDRAIEIHKILDLGEDPNVKSITILEKDTATFRDLWKDYIADAELRGVKRLDNLKRLGSYVMPSLGSIPVDQIQPAHIREALLPIAKRAGPLCNRTRAAVRACFEFGIKCEYSMQTEANKSYGIKSNPVSSVPPLQGVEKVGNRYPSLRQLAMAWVHAPDYGSVITANALRFHIAACGQRCLETLSIRYDQIQEIDGEQCVYLEDTKTGAPHTYVIGRLAQTVLDSIRPYTGEMEVVFSSTRSRKQSMAYNSMNRIVRKMRDEVDGFEAWTPKECRRAAKSILADEGLSIEHLDFVQNHSQRGTVSGRHYLRGSRVEIKAKVVEKWDNLLASEIRKYELEQNDYLRVVN